LGKLVDEHLGKLGDLPVVQLGQKRGKGQIDGAPGHSAREVALDNGAKPDHVGQEDLGVFGRFGNGEGMGQVETEPLQIGQRLIDTEGPVDGSQP
jgi:hypothetical protein